MQQTCVEFKANRVLDSVARNLLLGSPFITLHLIPTMRPFTSALLLSILSLAALGAHAGAVTNGTWAPSGCGPKPVTPQLDLKDPDAFNRSVAGVNTYRQAITPYLNCLVQEGNADIQTITKSAAAAQQAAKEANDKIQADVKAADEKFK
jgi:hypothetical protein